MINMNSNVVYGAQVCHNGSTDYTQNYHHAHDTAAALSYYQQATDLTSQASNGPVPATPASTHYAPSLGHMGTTGTHPHAHQFPEHPHTGVINESNGLSYTNLDTQAGYGPAVAPHQRSIYDSRGHATNGQTPATGGQAPGAGLQSLTTHQGYAQYRDFSPDSVPGGHDMVSALTDCAVMRSAGQPTSQYPYLEPSLLSRRNGNHHPSLSPYDAAAFSEMSCSQLNGSPYHLNHLTSHLHHPPHHHHGRTGQNAVTAAAPVPTYKWMQVKRNVPKPGEFKFMARYHQNNNRSSFYKQTLSTVQ